MVIRTSKVADEANSTYENGSFLRKHQKRLIVSSLVCFVLVLGVWRSNSSLMLCQGRPVSQQSRSDSPSTINHGHTTTSNLIASCPLPSSNHTFIIYNRLGKCGSTSTSNMLSTMAKQNDFLFEQSSKYGLQLADRLNDPSLVRALNKSASGHRALYVNHVHYFGDVYDICPESPRPGYIQIVREPMARVISQFYFLTNPTWKSKFVRQNIKRLQQEAGWDHPVSDFDTCANHARHPEKCERTNEMTKYFCGHGRECQDPSSPEALETALFHLQHGYIFVGLLEEFQTTFQMLERLLPSFFQGASKVAIPHSNSGRSGTNNVASYTTLHLLRQWNANDIYLYEFIVEKFHREVKACLS